MAPWQEAVAVQDFGPAYDRYGSSAPHRCALDARGMSAMPPIPTKLMHHNEPSRGAKRRRALLIDRLLESAAG